MKNGRIFKNYWLFLLVALNVNAAVFGMENEDDNKHKQPSSTNFLDSSFEWVFTDETRETTPVSFPTDTPAPASVSHSVNSTALVPDDLNYLYLGDSLAIDDPRILQTMKRLLNLQDDTSLLCPDVFSRLQKRNYDTAGKLIEQVTRAQDTSPLERDFFNLVQADLMVQRSNQNREKNQWALDFLNNILENKTTLRCSAPLIAKLKLHKLILLWSAPVELGENTYTWEKVLHTPLNTLQSEFRTDHTTRVKAIDAMEKEILDMPETPVAVRLQIIITQIQRALDNRNSILTTTGLASSELEERSYKFWVASLSSVIDNEQADDNIKACAELTLNDLRLQNLIKDEYRTLKAVYDSYERLRKQKIQENFRLIADIEQLKMLENKQVPVTPDLKREMAERKGRLQASKATFNSHIQALLSSRDRRLASSNASKAYFNGNIQLMLDVLELIRVTQATQRPLKNFQPDKSTIWDILKEVDIHI